MGGGEHDAAHSLLVAGALEALEKRSSISAESALRVSGSFERKRRDAAVRDLVVEVGPRRHAAILTSGSATLISRWQRPPEGKPDSNGSAADASRTAADAVLKPDYAPASKHFIFTDEHERLRESISRFAKRSSRRTPTAGRRRPSMTGSSRAWASSASSGSRCPSATAARAATTTQPRPRGGDREGQLAAASAWASRCTPTWSCRRCSPSAPRTRSSASSLPRSAAS